MLFNLLRLASSALVLAALLGGNVVASEPATTPPAAARSASDADPIVARGKGIEIRRSELDKKLASHRARNPDQELPPETEAAILNHLIEVHLVFHKANDAEKAKGKKNADEQFANIVNHMGAADFENRLKTIGMTADDLRGMLFIEAAADASLARQLGLTLTDDEVEAELKKHFDNFPGAYDQPPKALIRELLLLTTAGYSSDPLPPNRIELKRKKILELRQKVRDGEDFARLAALHNEDVMTKTTGGLRPPFAASETEFGNVAFSMKPNEISEVITDSDGFRFFQLLEIIPAKKVQFADVVETLRSDFIGAENKRLGPAYLRKLIKEAGAEIVDPALRAASPAGESDPAAIPSPTAGNP